MTVGDPAGCGPAITSAAWTELRAHPEFAFFVLGPPELYSDALRVEMIQNPEEAVAAFRSALPVLPVDVPLSAPVIAGTPNSENAPATIESIRNAVELALQGEVGAVVTNPISKAVLYDHGFEHPGHTEYIASLCNAQTGANDYPVMMLVGGGLKVALATIHIPLKDVPNALNSGDLERVARTVHSSLRLRFGCAEPRIAFAGVNPHAGENGAIGQEEIELINPLAEALRAEGLSITDARPGDTVFNEALGGAFDAVIAMSHDQGLIPVKILDFWGGVNTTIGLPIIRTSPDHGTAYDAARNGTARPESLISAIRLAAEMIQHRDATSNG